MKVSRGLTVICLGTAEDGGYARSKSWRLELDEEDKTLAQSKPLRVYVESTPRDRQGHWVIGDNWAFVRENADYYPPISFFAMAPVEKAGGNWQYTWKDYSAALLVILPPEVGAFAATPSPRVIVKAGRDGQARLGLWFDRPAKCAEMENWVAEWQSFELSKGTSLGSIVSNLNDKNRTYGHQQSAAPAPVQICREKRH